MSDSMLHARDEVSSTSFSTVGGGLSEEIDGVYQDGVDQAGLRKGKWTLEEEEYTRRLVQHFNNGLLMIPDETTLRAFLSSRLKCDRMRITKKFRGICFGRKYKSCDKTQANMVLVQQAAEELKTLEKRFLERDEQEQDKRAAIQEETDSRLMGTGPISRHDRAVSQGSQGIQDVGSGRVESTTRDFIDDGNVTSSAQTLESDVAETMHENGRTSIIMHQTTKNESESHFPSGMTGSTSEAKSDGGKINSLQARRVASLLDKPSEALLLVLGQKYLAQLKKQARALHEAQREATSLHGNTVDVSPSGTDTTPVNENTTAMLLSSEVVLPTANNATDAQPSSSSPSSASSSSSSLSSSSVPASSSTSSSLSSSASAATSLSPSSSKSDERVTSMNTNDNIPDAHENKNSTSEMKRPYSSTLDVDKESASQSLEPGKRVKVMACNDEDSDAGKLLLGFFNTVNKKKAMRVAGEEEDVVKEEAVRKLNELPTQGGGRQVSNLSCHF